MAACQAKNGSAPHRRRFESRGGDDRTRSFVARGRVREKSRDEARGDDRQGLGTADEAAEVGLDNLNAAPGAALAVDGLAALLGAHPGAESELAGALYFA